MRRPLLAAPFVFLVGCDVNVEKAFDLFTGREANVVVLLDKPTQLGPTPSTLTSSKGPMKVLGKWSSLCLSLRGEVPLQDTKVMDRVFAEAMGNAKQGIYWPSETDLPKPPSTNKQTAGASSPKAGSACSRWVSLILPSTGCRRASPRFASHVKREAS